MAEFTVPKRTSQAQLPSSLGLPQSTPEDFGAGIAEALGGIAVSIEKRQQEIEQENNRIFALDLKNQLNQKFRNEKLLLNEVKGAAVQNIFSTEQERLERERGEFVGAYSDPTQQQIAGEVFDSTSNTYLNSVVEFQVKERPKYHARVKDELIFNAQQEAIDSPVGDMNELARQSQVIADNIEDPIKAQKAIDDLYKEAYNHWTNVDSEIAMESYAENKEFLEARLGTAISNIEDTILIAERERINRLEKADTEAEKQHKKAQTLRTANYIADVGTQKEPTLPQLKTDLRNQNITKTQYDAIVSDINNPTVIRDVEKYNILYREIVDNPAEDHYAQIHQPDNGLTIDDKKTLGSTLARNLDSQFNSDFKKGEEELEGAIATTGPLAPFKKTEDEDRLRIARRELEGRLAENENLREILDDMLPRYRSKPITLKSLPTPRYYKKPVNIADVKEAQKQLAIRYDVGGLDESILNREAELLEAYSDILGKGNIE